jgi:hypothetical protein
MSLKGTQYFLGNTEIINSFVGEDAVLFDPQLNISRPTGSVTTTNLLAWFKADEYGGSGDWLSYTGSVAATASFGGSPSYNGVGFEFTPTDYMQVQPYQSFNFNEDDDAGFLPAYTIIVFGRYIGAEGDTHGRLLTGGVYTASTTSVNQNWHLGTYNDGTPKTQAFFTSPGLSGVGGFIYGPTGAYDTTFRMYAGSAKKSPTIPVNKFWLNGQLLNTKTARSIYYGPYSVGINTGSYATPGGLESNNCEVGDILIYSAELATEEIFDIYNFIGPRFGI